MRVTEDLIAELSNNVNTAKSKADHTYVPPYDIKKSVEAFLWWLEKNNYEIIKRKETL